MKKFEELDQSLQNQIIDICKDDPYNLNPEFLYINMFNSIGNIQTLSKVFEVPETLIIKIKEQGKIKMKIIKEVANNSAILRFVEHNNKKFKLTYDNRNGTPLGFDYRFQAELLKDDVWKTIAGKNDIEFKEISYVSDKPRLLEDSKRFFKMMEEHLSLMY